MIHGFPSVAPEASVILGDPHTTISIEGRLPFARPGSPSLFQFYVLRRPTGCGEAGEPRAKERRLLGRVVVPGRGAPQGVAETVHEREDVVAPHAPREQPVPALALASDDEPDEPTA